MSDLRLHPPMEVQIVEDDTGTSPIPEYDSSWSDLDALRWHAGVLKARTGIEITITTGGLTIDGRTVWDAYGWTAGRFSGSSTSYSKMWSWINGVEFGYRFAKEKP